MIRSMVRMSYHISYIPQCHWSRKKLTLPPLICSNVGIRSNRINSLALATIGSRPILATAVTLPFLAWYVTN